MVEATHRNDKLIYNLYKRDIHNLFEQFEDKHKQFYELFDASTYRACKNSFVSGRNLFWLDEEINKITLIKASKESFKDILIQIDLKEYQFKEKNPFSISSKLEFKFHPYKYEIIFARKKIEKKYGEFLSPEEKDQIINESIKAVFDEIKAKSEK